ncbi:reverse transcriptase domain-containing protein [Tanacetum coccineum]
MAKIFLGKYFPPSMVTKLRNDITNFRQKPDESLFEAWERYKLSIDRCPNHNMLPVTQIDTFYNGLTLRHHDTINAAAGEIVALKLQMEEMNRNLTRMLQTNQQVKALKKTNSSKELVVFKTRLSAIQAPAYQALPYQAPVHQAPIPQPQVEKTNEFKTYIDANDAILKNCNAFSRGSGTLPSNTVTNPREDLKGITTRSGVVYQGPTIPTTSSSPPKCGNMNRGGTKDTVPPTNNESTKDVQPLVVQVENHVPISEPVVDPVSAPMPNPKPSILYPRDVIMKDDVKKLTTKLRNSMKSLKI